MIRININSKDIDLGGLEKIRVKEIYPLFNEDITSLSYTFPTEFPLTATNKIAFGFLDEPDTNLDFTTSFPAYIFLNNSLVFSGTFELSEVSEAGFKGMFLEHDFDKTILEQSIRDIDYGGDREVVGGGTGYAKMREHADASVLGSVDEWDYVFFPVQCPNFYQGKNIYNYMSGPNGVPTPHTYTGIVNLWDYDKGTFWDNPVDAELQSHNTPPPSSVSDIPEYATTQPPTASTFVPYPYFLYVIKKVSEHLGLLLTGDFMRTELARKAVIYNTFSLDKTESFVGVTYTGTYYLNECNSTINIRNHIPDISISTFLNAIKIFGLSVIIDTQNKRLIIDTKKDKTILPDEFNITPFTPPALSITENESSFVSEMVFARDGGDPAWEALEEKKIDSKVKDDVTSGGWPSGSVYGDVRFFVTNWRDTINAPVPYTSAHHTNARTLYFGAKGKKYSFDVGTLLTKHNNRQLEYNTNVGDGVFSTPAIVYETGIMPYDESGGTSSVYEVEADFSFRIILYAGMQDVVMGGIGTFSYPMGTTDIYDDAKNPVITNSLKWKGHDGAIYPYWWEPFLETLSDKKMSVTAAMPLPHYHTISENKSIKIRLKNRLYYIESLDAEFSNKDPYNVICKISLIQIK